MFLPLVAPPPPLNAKVSTQEKNLNSSNYVAESLWQTKAVNLGGRTKCQPDKMPTGHNANQRLAFCPEHLNMFWHFFQIMKIIFQITFHKMWFSWFRQNAKTCWDGPDKMPTKKLGRTKCQPQKKIRTKCQPLVGIMSGWHFVRLAFCPTTMSFISLLLLTILLLLPLSKWCITMTIIMITIKMLDVTLANW